MNKYIDSSLLDKAIAFAVKAHSNTERRDKGFPYIVHPLEAMAIVATITSDQELLAAAVLHDTVEDTDTTVEQLRSLFGPRVARLVECESDKGIVGVNESATWKERKLFALNRLKSADRDVKIVALGDKLSNVRAIAADYRRLGDKLWQRFHAPNGRADHQWRYLALVDAFEDLSDTDAYRELAEKVHEVFGSLSNEVERIDINDYEQCGESYASQTYNDKSGEKIVKLYADFVPLSVSKTELRLSKDIEAMGIKVPKAFRMVTDGSRIGVEFQRIKNKISFARAISLDPSRLEDYVSTFASMCKKLHSTPCNTSCFISATEHFTKVVSQSTFLDDDQKAKALAFIDSVPRTINCLHGDMHIGNVVTDGKENWWIDLGDFGYGYHLFDFGMLNIVCNCITEAESVNVFHLGTDMTKQVWKVFVKQYFGTDDYDEVERKVSPFSALCMIYWGERDHTLPRFMPYIEKWLLS